MKKLTDSEKALFSILGYPGISENVPIEVKAGILYSLRNGSISDAELSNVFEEQYLKILDAIQKRKMFLDFNNYVYDYFFTIHNKEMKSKVLPAQFVGFRVDMKSRRNTFLAKVKYFNGIEEDGLQLFPLMKMSDLNLNDYLLVHNKMVCMKINENDYKNIIEKYFNNR